MQSLLDHLEKVYGGNQGTDGEIVTEIDSEEEIESSFDLRFKVVKNLSDLKRSKTVHRNQIRKMEEEAEKEEEEEKPLEVVEEVLQEESRTMFRIDSNEGEIGDQGGRGTFYSRKDVPFYPKLIMNQPTFAPTRDFTKSGRKNS